MVGYADNENVRLRNVYPVQRGCVVLKDCLNVCLVQAFERLHELNVVSWIKTGGMRKVSFEQEAMSSKDMNFWFDWRSFNP